MAVVGFPSPEDEGDLLPFDRSKGYSGGAKRSWFKDFEVSVELG